MKEFLLWDFEFDQDKLHKFIFGLLNVPELLISIISPSYKIKEINPTFLSFTDERYTDVIGKDFVDFFKNQHIIPPFSHKEISSQQQLINSTKTQRYGNDLYINWYISPVLNSQRDLISYLLIGIDITKQKLAEENERKSKQYFEKIINTVPSYIFWKDKDSIFLGCNHLFAEAAGLSKPEEIIGKSDYDLPWQRWESEAYIADDRKVIASGKPKLNIEEIQTLKDGSQITLLTNKVPFYDDKNKIIGILAVYTDITERKKIEEALRKAKEAAEVANRSKTAFIANMSHDVRTPLTGVIGISEVLEHEGETPKDRELGQTIHVSAERLLQLLDDILEVISADELDELNLNLNTFNLKARLDFVRELLTSNTQQYHVNLIFNISEGVPHYIISDRVKVDRILLNLISNALKFTASGTISVSVNLLNRTENEAVLEFKIVDTGIGIPDDQLDKIFDRFYRIDPSYHNKYRGHGIGLFIVQKYVYLLKGKITVESEVGKGTTFSVVLPVKIGSASDILVQDDTPEISHFIEKRNVHQIRSVETKRPSILVQSKLSQQKQLPRVLVIEDDTVARRVVKSMLTRAGFEVEEVEDAEQGFWHVIKRSYDLIVTDIGLPHMDGIEFSIAVRAWEKATHNAAIPIVGLTAHGKSQQVVAKEAGMDMLLSKPLDEQKLQAINEHFFAKAPELSDKLPQNKPIGLGYELPETEEKLFELDIYPLLDAKQGIEVSGGDVSFFKEILRILIEQTLPEELLLLVRAREVSDWELIQSIAHKLKGGALYCGTLRMRYACQYMERYLLAGHSKLQSQLYDQLMMVLSQTQLHLVEWLALNR